MLRNRAGEKGELKLKLLINSKPAPKKYTVECHVLIKLRSDDEIFLQYSHVQVTLKILFSLI